MKSCCPLISKTMIYVGSPTIRNRGTIGGTLADADRTAELPAVAVALEAELIALGPKGARRIPAADFFRGDLSTDKRTDEMLREIRFPVSPNGSLSAFTEATNRHHDLALVGVAVYLEIEDSGTVAKARIVCNGIRVPLPSALNAPNKDFAATVPTPTQFTRRRNLVWTASSPRAIWRPTPSTVAPCCRVWSQGRSGKRSPADRVPSERRKDPRADVGERLREGRTPGGASLALADFLRYELRLTGTHVGARTASAGPVRFINGNTSRSCITLAVQLDGASIETVKALARSGALSPLQEALHEHHALQCGFCTPGFLMTAPRVAGAPIPEPSEQTIRRALAGNICRCTGYVHIVRAIHEAARQRLAEFGAEGEAPELEAQNFCCI